MFDKIINGCVGILPEKLQKIYYKYEDIFLYVFFGALTTLVSLVSQFAAAAVVGKTGAVAITIATTFSWICAVTFAFFTNKKYVFKSETKTKKDFWRQFFSFYGARAVSYFMQLGLMILFEHIFDFDIFFWYITATVVTQFVILAANYLFSKLWIFKKK